MATFAIQLTPLFIDYTPSDKQLNDTKSLLESYCSYLEYGIDLKVFSKPQLITSGAAFDSLKCPACAKIINRFGYDDDEWWDQMETVLYESNDPLTESITMPCCSQSVSATQFNFGADAIFAKYLIRAREYELHSGSGELNSKQLEKLAKAFGSKLVQIIGVNG